MTNEKPDCFGEIRDCEQCRICEHIDECADSLAIRVLPDSVVEKIINLVKSSFPDEVFVGNQWIRNVPNGDYEGHGKTVIEARDFLEVPIQEEYEITLTLKRIQPCFAGCGRRITDGIESMWMGVPVLYCQECWNRIRKENY